MNKEMLHRLKTAGEYQSKAIHALFPEEMGKHLDVIEKEMKMMVVEVAAELLKNCNKDETCRDGHNYERNYEESHEQSRENSYEQNRENSYKQNREECCKQCHGHRYEQSSGQTLKVKKVDIM